MSASDAPNQQIAVALKYNPDKDNAPVIVASGGGHVAQKILEIAGKHGVPVYQDNSAASLLARFQPGQQVTPELYQIIAEIYAYILQAGYNLKKQSNVFPTDFSTDFFSENKYKQ